MRASGDEGEMFLPFGLAEQLTATGAAHWTSSHGAGVALPSVLAAGGELLGLFRDMQASSDKPVVVVVDDLHWADIESAGALLFAFRRLRADRVLTLLSVRPDEFGRLGDGWSRYIAGDGRVSRLRLGGFESSDLVAWRRPSASVLCPRGRSRLCSSTRVAIPSIAEPSSRS